MSSFKEEIFDGKNLADIFRDIYTNTDTKRKQINEFIKKLVLLIKTPEDAIMLGPVIKDFMEVNVKNDEHLVRVAQIAQRIVTVGTKAGSLDGILSEKEKEQILSDLSVEVQEIKKQADELDADLSDLSKTNDWL